MERMKNKFEELLEVFDKKYLEDVFDEGEKIGAFPKDKPINGIKYLYNGYLYNMTRQRVKKMRMNNEGRLDFL